MFKIIVYPIYFRQEEKKILDRIMGPKVYDSRIRPSGLNGTGTYKYVRVCVCMCGFKSCNCNKIKMFHFY